MSDILVDYTEKFSGVFPFHPKESILLAQGKGKHFLALIKADELKKRYDGKKGGYLLEYRELSQECQNSDDEAYVCVLSDETQIWQRKEVKKLLEEIKADKENVNMFDHFNIF